MSDIAISDPIFTTEVSGNPTHSAIVTIGTWDPFRASHFKLVQEMVAEAQSAHCDPVAVLLDPPPVKYLPGKWNWPIFDDPAVRIQRLLQLGIRSVIRVIFEARHVHLGAAEILGTVLGLVPVRELWVGANQQFGRGEKGGKNAILSLGQEQGFVVRILDPLPISNHTGPAITELLLAGKIAVARELVGRAPTFAAPLSENPLLLTWPPGPYRAVPLPHIDAPIKASDRQIPVELARRDETYSQILWPDIDHPYLAITAGPSESAREA